MQCCRKIMRVLVFVLMVMAFISITDVYTAAVTRLKLRSLGIWVREGCFFCLVVQENLIILFYKP